MKNSNDRSDQIRSSNRNKSNRNHQQMNQQFNRKSNFYQLDGNRVIETINVKISIPDSYNPNVQLYNMTRSLLSNQNNHIVNYHQFIVDQINNQIIKPISVIRRVFYINLNDKELKLLKDHSIRGIWSFGKFIN